MLSACKIIKFLRNVQQYIEKKSDFNRIGCGMVSLHNKISVLDVSKVCVDILRLCRKLSKDYLAEKNLRRFTFICGNLFTQDLLAFSDDYTLITIVDRHSLKVVVG